MEEKLPLKAELDTNPHGRLIVECQENGPIQTNTYFAISGTEAVVIDPAWDGEKLARDFIAAHPGIEIRAMVCTHCHADHIGGVAGMRRVLGEGVPFIISAVDAPHLDFAVQSMEQMWGIKSENAPAPDRLVGEGDVIEFGDVRLQVMQTPGHTPGGVVLFAATVDGDFAFVGDTLFPGGHGRCDLEGGSEAKIMRSLARMAASLPEDTLCYIGHGCTTTMAKERSSNVFMKYAVRHEH